MNEEIRARLETFPADVRELFLHLRTLIYDSSPAEPAEMQWARMPSYSVGNAFVRLIPFKDHINIEAKAVALHREELTGYKITPKGMLQIYVNQPVPEEALRRIFAETLGA